MIISTLKPKVHLQSLTGRNGGINMKPIKIITDTCSDITPEIAEKYNIELLPIHIIFGDKEYLDRYEITAEEFYEKLKTEDVHPKTAQVTVQDHADAFKKFASDYTIIHIPLSASASGTYQSACIARESVIDEIADAEIHVYENMQLSYGYGLWVIEAAKMASDGKSADEILAMLDEKTKNVEILFSVSTLDYLQKGGRISSASKLIANVLDISPILAVEGGLVVSKEKVRGSKKVVAKIASIFSENALDDPDQKIYVMHGADPEKAQKLIEKIKEKTNFSNFETACIGPCIGIHAGPGAIGVIYQKKN